MRAFATDTISRSFRTFAASTNQPINPAVPATGTSPGEAAKETAGRANASSMDAASKKASFRFMVISSCLKLKWNTGCAECKNSR